MSIDESKKLARDIIEEMKLRQAAELPNDGIMTMLKGEYVRFTLGGIFKENYPHPQAFFANMLHLTSLWHRVELDEYKVRYLGTFQYDVRDLNNQSKKHNPKKNAEPFVSFDFAFYSVNETLAFPYMFGDKTWPFYEDKAGLTVLHQWGYELTDTPSAGDLAVYLNHNQESEEIKHIGVYANNQVYSKWGVFPDMYAHHPETLPAIYGDTLFFARKSRFPDLTKPALDYCDACDDANFKDLSANLEQLMVERIELAEEDLLHGNQFGPRKLNQWTTLWDKTRHQIKQITEEETCSPNAMSSIETLLKSMKI